MTGNARRRRSRCPARQYRLPEAQKNQHRRTRVWSSAPPWKAAPTMSSCPTRKSGAVLRELILGPAGFGQLFFADLTVFFAAITEADGAHAAAGIA